MSPNTFVVLVVLNLEQVAMAKCGGLPVIEVTDTRSLDDALRVLMQQIGFVQNLGAAKLVDVVQAEDGTLVIGYRMRTRSRGVNDGYEWAAIEDDAGGDVERYLLDKAWHSEDP